jgi:hypothetical protein
MKLSKSLFLIAGMITIMGCATMNAGNLTAKPVSGQSAEFYQLKTYFFNSDEQMLITDNYLRIALLPAIKRLGIKNVGVFKPRPSQTDTIKRTVLLIPYSSFSQFLSMEEELTKDEAYLTAGKDYLNANYDKPPYKRIESALLKAFKDMPFIQAPALDGERSKRVYELRSYESATEAYHNSKVDMFNAGGEIKLFERLKFNAVFYARVISGSNMPNLIYMISFSDEASRKEHWDAFSNSAEWKELKAIPKYLNTVSHIDMSLLYPTDYSDY